MSDALCSTGPGSKDAVVSPLAGRLIVVVGAGGAAKAIAYGAKKKGTRVVVANRTYGKIFFLFGRCSSAYAHSLYLSIHLSSCPFCTGKASYIMHTLCY